ncbi:MAG: hypothetical protein IV100_31700 [Myxococcales bacterium]|nr:hypothetical protein [Myxococcales bacterium]
MSLPKLLERLLIVSAVFFAALPFLATHLPPAADLGQHVAQIRLLADVADGSRPELEVSWGAPGTGVYLGMLALSWVLPMGYVGWAALLLLVVAWAGTLAWVAVRRERDLASAVLAGIFIFGASVYWGLLQFIAGWPVLLVWFVVVEGWRRKPEGHSETRYLALIFATAVALYLSHTMWLPVGMLWLLLRLPGAQLTLRRFLLLSLVLSPVVSMSIYWYVDVHLYRLALPSQAIASEWRLLPWERLGLMELRHLVLGGLRGGVERVMVMVALGWLALGLGMAVHRRWTRGEVIVPSQRVDRQLLGLAAIPTAIALFAPDQFLMTILMPERFAGGALMLLLVALPAPVWAGSWAAAPRLVAWGIAAVFALATTASWGIFAEECDGIDASISQLPERPRVLGLDFADRSSVILGRPFMHAAALAQAQRGGQINFSFADFGSSLVRSRHPTLPKWNPVLEWQPDRVGDRDLLHFDYVLVNADEETHARFLAFSKGTAVVTGTRFRLIRLPNGQ